MTPNFWMGLFLLLLTYYVASESNVLPTLRCGDHESSLFQNGGLSVACCSTSRCVYFLVVFSFLLCLLIGLAESATLPASSLDRFQYLSDLTE